MTLLNKKILVVDDLVSMAELWKMKFSQMGFDVHIALDGDVALEEMNKNVFDLILLDIYMPGKNGIEVLGHKAETLNAATPTYVISSTLKDEDLVKAKSLGAKKAFLKYQITPKDVVGAVKEELHI